MCLLLAALNTSRKMMDIKDTLYGVYLLGKIAIWARNCSCLDSLTEHCVNWTCRTQDSLERTTKPIYRNNLDANVNFQKTTNNKKHFLRLPASRNSSQKVLKTETQGINAMQWQMYEGLLAACGFRSERVRNLI
ncbi:hypothetical protein STEG23_018292, partial [Scotinomys teguina]